MAFLKCLGLKIGRRPSCKNVDHQDPDQNRDAHELDDEKRKDYDSVRRFNWDDIERYTMNFSDVIGSGGFSTVYLAHFPACLSLGSGMGAIKIHFGSERLNQLFKQELDILLHLRHENIVKLIGYCDDGGEFLV